MPWRHSAAAHGIAAGEIKMRSTRGRGFPTHVLIPSWKLLACAAGACACSPNTNPTAVCSASLRRTCVEAASAPFGAAVRAHEVGPCVAHTRTYREHVHTPHRGALQRAATCLAETCGADARRMPGRTGPVVAMRRARVPVTWAVTRAAASPSVRPILRPSVSHCATERCG